MSVTLKCIICVQRQHW